MRTTCVSYAHDMTPPKSPKLRKQLYLTETAIQQGEALQTAMCRNSFSNVVEALIDGEHKRQFPTNGQQQPEVKEAA